jgi:predicted nucleotidyltransferase
MIGEIENVLDALNRARVRYLVVGGVAVVLHGYLRTTADLDLVIQLEHQNTLRAMQALRNLQYRPRAPVPAEAFAESGAREHWIRDQGLTVFSLWSPAHPTLEIDLFVSEPFDFDAVYSRALRVPLEKIEATVIALDDLIALKRRVGRPRDVEDVAALESLRETKGRDGESGNG